MVVIQEQQTTALYLYCKGCSSTDHVHMEKLHFSGSTLEKQQTVKGDHNID